MSHLNAPHYLSVQKFVEQCRNASVMRITNSTIAVAEIEDRIVRFAVSNPNDVIQRSHNAGRFFEPEELASLRDALPAGGVFVDIGANIGNHALYAAIHLEAARVIPIEPGKQAIKMLIENITLNALHDRFDLSHLGLGLSDRVEEDLKLETAHPDNLGMTALKRGGDIPVAPGDLLLADELRIDVMKIDVEGMEMAALAGLSQTIERLKPKILIEVDHGNRAAFDNWLAATGYEVTTTFRRMVANQNFLLSPQ